MGNEQQNLFDPVPQSKLECLSKEELIEFIQAQESVVKLASKLKKENDRLKNLNEELKQKKLLIDEQYVVIKNKLFGKSSEKSPSREAINRSRLKSKKKKVQLPSLKHPNLPLIEKSIEIEGDVSCPCCEAKMEDSGLTEESEYLTKIPAQFYVIRQKRHKYRCRSCQGALVTAPAPKRIVEGGAFSDELIVDAALSKYCDLIPIERYVKIAKREGLLDLAPNSLIEQTHHLAQVLKPVYNLIKSEVLESRVLHADETPHKMLEGDKKSNWYLWGFSNERASYLEARDTRSGDVASELLKKSKCRYLMSDVFSGYGKAVKETNKHREFEKQSKIESLYCNAHSRRKFKEASSFNESEFYIKTYGKIYRLNKWLTQKEKELKFFQKKRIRRYQNNLFKKIKDQCLKDLVKVSKKSSLAKAVNYFLNNYEGLTRFLKNTSLPIDNNQQERLLRSPVIGRKTWYGNHSKRGAETSSILFTLVESCKLNKVNPREYFKKLVQSLHEGKNPYTPYTYKISTG